MADGSADPGPDQKAAVATGQPVGTFAPFASRPFREVWGGNVLSQLGSQLQAVGAAWMMTELTRSHTLVAAVQASNILPMLFLSVFAGAIADNYDRRRIMLIAQTAMLVLSTVLAVLAWRGMLGAHGLLAFTLAVGAGTTLGLPAWQASVRSLVPSRVLPQAISLNSVAFNLARTVGPALGGLVLATAGVATAFALNAVSYIGLILALFRWRPDRPAPVREPLLPSIRAGLSFCFRSVPVRRILLRGVGFSVGAIAVQALMPIVVRDMLHGAEAEYGIVLGLFGSGSVFGALFSPGMRRRYGSDNTVALGAACVAAALVGLAYSGSVGQAFACPLLAGGGWALTLTTLNVSMQVRSPEEILGRCLAIYQAVTFGAAAIGAWSWGLLADASSARIALLAGAGWVAVATVILRIVSPLPARGQGVVLTRA